MQKKKSESLMTGVFSALSWSERAPGWPDWLSSREGCSVSEGNCSSHLIVSDTGWTPELGWHVTMRDEVSSYISWDVMP